MSLFVTALNSGSNANCYYIGTQEEAVLIDAGLSCRETEKRLKRLGLSFDNIKAIFISHEHSDHVRGLPGIMKKHARPAYITEKTRPGSRLHPEHPQLFSFAAHEAVSIGTLQVTAFPKYHDAADPHSFVVSYQGTHVGIMTDIGSPCENVRHYFSQCHAVILEANYDDALLDAGRYPHFLKQRIRSNHGHLSNRQALELLRENRPAQLSHLFLGHLSKDNNCPELVQELFEAEAGNTQVIVASRYAETELVEVKAAAVVQTQEAG